MIKRLGLGGYPFTFVLCVGETHEKIMRFFERERYGGHRCTIAKCCPDHSPDHRDLNLTLNHEGKTFGCEMARFVRFPACGTMLLLLDRSLRVRTIESQVYVAHEAFHMVRHVMEMIRVPLEDSTEEAWAYLLMDIITRVTTELRK